MSHPCRFLFSDDHARLITLSSLQVDDLPLSDTWAQGMRLRFQTEGNARVMVRPLITCNMRFVVDPTAPGVLPKPEEVALDDEHYNQWKVQGTLMLDLTIAGKTIGTLGSNLLVKPNRIWFGPVTIPKEFLFESLTQKERLARDPINLFRPSTDPAKELRWKQHAISQFLAGVYDATVMVHPTDATKDDALRMPMPLVGFNSATNIHELKVYAANAGEPEDAADAEWDPGKTAEQREAARRAPNHPRNGVIPARLVYQELRTNMLPAVTVEAKAVRDRVVEPAPAPAPRAFYPIQFTRTWKVPTTNPYDISIYFPQQQVVFRSPANAELRRQTLPAHGILWVDGNFYANFSAGTRIELEGGMRWLQWSENVWMRKGEQTPVPMTTGPNPQHIVVRLPMSKAMLEDDTRSLGDSGRACTYFSMRRTVRAWIDNRVCGGRLSKDVNDRRSTRLETRALIPQAVRGSTTLINNKPDPAMDPDDGVRLLLPLFVTLFPNDCVQHPIPGVDPPADREIWSQGRAAVYLWQSAQPTLKNPKNVRNFSDNDVGRGGAGAIVMLGLGEYHCNETPPVNPSSDTQYIDELVGIMMNGGLNPGAATQLWRNVAFYRDMINRTKTAVDPDGHSPVFARYNPQTGVATGMRIIDQGGEDTIQVLGTAPTRRFDDGKVWIAANWTE